MKNQTDPNKDLLIKAQHHKGWLKKKSPAVLKSWQDRFFMIINDGQQFAYFEDDKISSKAKGAIDTSSIIDIQKIDKKTFKIHFPGRDFELRAKTEQECEEWIKNLTIVKVNSQQEGRVSNRTKSVASNVKMENKKDETGSKSWKDIDASIFQQIQAEREQECNQNTLIDVLEQEKKDFKSDEDDEKSKAENQKEKKLLASSDILVKLGLSSYINKMNPQFINNRLLCGYIGKRSKGKLKYFQKRWFILVSAKPLYPLEYNDEKILDETQLPPWLELEVLYYFDDVEQESRPKGDIKMSECQELIVKNQQKSKEAGFSFKINMGDRLFHLMTDTESDRIRWTTALNNSIQTVKEMNNPLKIKIIKNIDPIIYIYDNQGTKQQKIEKLREKIDLDYWKIKDEQLGDEPYDDCLDSLLKFLVPLTKDMLDTLNGCIVKEPQRKDIIKEYTECLHDKICEMLTEFWDKKYSTFDSANLLNLSNWMMKYRDQLKDFFEDDRFLQGVRTLLTIYINRSIESVESVIQGIVDHEKTTPPFLNENQQYITQAPVDLYKMINEGFDLGYKLCPNKEMLMKNGYFAKTLVAQYQAGVEEIIDEAPLKTEQYVALCNNTIQLGNLTKQFCQRLKQFGLTDEEVDKCFDSQKIVKKFITISTIAKDKFFYTFFGGTQKFFKTFYLAIKLDDILKKLLEPAQELISQLHDSFSRKVWKQVLDVIVLYYFNCFIVSCPKAKKEHLKEFQDKLKHDQQQLEAEFADFFFESQLTACLKPFEDMSEFLESESLGILQPCKNLRIFFGKAFNEKTLKNIMSIRHDMSKEERKETTDACKDLLDDFNKTNADQEDEKNRFMDVLGQDDDDQEEEEKKQPEEDKNRRQDLTLDDFDDENDVVEEVQKKQSTDEEQKVEFIEEGFLDKKKPKEKGLTSLMVNPVKNLVHKWDHRYVRIRKGHLYWYISDRSREAQNKLDLNKVDDIISTAEKNTVFALVLEGGKKYKFKADSKHIRDVWVKSILKEQQKSEQSTVQKMEAIKTGEGKKQIIKDYDEIARKERQKQKAEERRKKRLEREAEAKRKLLEQKKQQQQELEALAQSVKVVEPTPVGKPMSMEVDDQTPQKKTVSCFMSLLIALGIERGD